MNKWNWVKVEMYHPCFDPDMGGSTCYSKVFCDVYKKVIRSYNRVFAEIKNIKERCGDE